MTRLKRWRRFARTLRLSDAPPLAGVTRFVAVNVLAASGLMPTRLRVPLLRWGGIEIADGAQVREGCRFEGRVSIGVGSFLNNGAQFDAGDATIEIGAGVGIGVNCIITAADHQLGGQGRRIGALKSADIRICDGCWVGAGSIILAGVRVAPGSVIGAGSVVTRDTMPDAVYAGVPARLLRHLDPERLEPEISVDRLGDELRRVEGLREREARERLGLDGPEGSRFRRRFAPRSRLS